MAKMPAAAPTKPTASFSAPPVATAEADAVDEPEAVTAPASEEDAALALARLVRVEPDAVFVV